MKTDFDQLTRAFVVSGHALAIALSEHLVTINPELKAGVDRAVELGEAATLVLEFHPLVPTIRLGTCDANGNMRRALSITGNTPVLQ